MSSFSVHPRGSWFARLRNWQPRATEIRYEESRCPSCARFGVLSYRLPGEALRDAHCSPGLQACHRFCPHCGISQPGYRNRCQIIYMEGGRMRHA